MRDLKEINNEIEKNSLGIFPFIGENTVIKLDKGFYKAKNRKYYGITYVINAEGDHEALLYGYYYIPEKMVIYRGNILEASEGKKSLIDFLQRKEYTLYDNLPKLTTERYEAGTEEYAAAKANFNEFIESKKKNDVLNQ